MSEPILIIMAAGMGSRYGGLKQMDPIGPCGELILDYSLYDARLAGFKRAIIIIKPENEADFREILGNRVSRYMDVRYAYQQLDSYLPEGFTIPPERTKPWGTGHAVLCARELTDAPFCVINSDDYYGREAFALCYNHLQNLQSETDYCMVGYRLKNTLSETGFVARGVCQTDSNQHLLSLVERTHIISTKEGPLMTEDQSVYYRLDPDTVVSMNMWGFPLSMMDSLSDGFPRFLSETLPRNPLKGEYFLPFQVNDNMSRGNAKVKVYTTPDRWFGVTYREDRGLVVDAMQQLSVNGFYPSPLWPEKTL